VAWLPADSAREVMRDGPTTIAGALNPPAAARRVDGGWRITGQCPFGSGCHNVAWLCRQLGLSRPVIVGHSMGGVIALALATLHPDLPAAIVAIDSPWLPNEQVRALVPGLTAAFNSAQFREAQRQLVRDAFFLPIDDLRRRERIVDDMSSA
jgi:pimeloyl-ACP methyl ester carboxylesterase